MGALMSRGNKRDAEFQSSSPPEDAYGHSHIWKKLKTSYWYSNLMAPKESLVSRLNRYPQQIPISREIHAPSRVIKGFTAKSKRSDISCSKHIRQKGYNSGYRIRMGNFFRSLCESLKKAVVRRRKLKLEKEDAIDVDDAPTVNDDNAVSDEDSSVEEVAIVECEREDVNESNELQDIISRYRKLDGEIEENLRFHPSTSSGMDSQFTEGKTLESLSLNQIPDDSYVDASLPYHKKLLNDSAKKHDRHLRRLSFEIKLNEQKRASYKQLQVEKEDEDTLIEPFRPLTDDEDEMVANAFSNSSRRKVLVTHENSNITITGEVLRCLKPGEWLNDEVINVYLELLKEREMKEPKKFLKCHFFNTFFYKKLISGSSGYDYKSVRRWTTQRKLGYSLLECDKIFIPVHKEIHWCLAVINKKEEKFQYLDSLGGVDKQVMRVLAKYIVDEVKDKNGEDIDVTSWKQEYVKDLPKQKNGFDCGVFMIKYADFYSRGIDLCFKQEHMPYFRLRTAKEILKLRAD